MKENRMKDVLESIAQRDVSPDVNLMPIIASRLERRSLMMTLRTRPVFLILVVLLTFMLLTGVVYAIGNLLGYIPGIGLVDQSVPIRVLEKTIEVKQGGLTIRVLKVVADATQTFVT